MRQGFDKTFFFNSHPFNTGPNTQWPWTKIECPPLSMLSKKTPTKEQNIFENSYSIGCISSRDVRLIGTKAIPFKNGMRNIPGGVSSCLNITTIRESSKIDKSPYLVSYTYRNQTDSVCASCIFQQSLLRIKSLRV